MTRGRGVFAVVAVAAALWAVVLAAGYGHSLAIGPVRISSRNPARPVWIAIAAAAAYAYASGRVGLREDRARFARAGRLASAAAARAYGRLEASAHPTVVAAVIVTASTAVSLAYRESTAGGSDAYSYVTQADLWSDSVPGLRIEIPIAAAAPWPDALLTFTPFGYRAASDGRGIVPVTPPGLPLLMAAFGAVAGHCSMFWVVPLSGGLFLWAIFLIGTRAGVPAVGVAAAWLAATSPTFLFMSRWVMSDVPAAAFWALATALAVRASTASAFAAGLSASAAILIRPNLAPLAIVLIAALAWRALRGGPRIGLLLLAFAAGVVPGCAAVAAINQWLYGSILMSGYGDLNSLFSAAHVATNLRRYATWLIETQTPVALIGVAALAVRWRRAWPTEEARAAARVLVGIAAATVALYCAYTPFEEWWYLRFLLPAWPGIFTGVAALILGLARGRGAGPRALAVLFIAALGIHAIATARRLGVYPPGEGERRYATVAQLVANATDPTAVIITTAHVGPMRYYGGRETMRYDVLDPAWLDRALDFFARRGHRLYILLEEQEVAEFRARFAPASRVGELRMNPILTYEAHQIPGRVYLFDPATPNAVTATPSPIVDPRPRCVAPR